MLRLKQAMLWDRLNTFFTHRINKVDLVAMRDVAASSETTIEPHVTAFISSTPPPGSGKTAISVFSARRAAINTVFGFITITHYTQ